MFKTRCRHEYQSICSAVRLLDVFLYCSCCCNISHTYYSNTSNMDCINKCKISCSNIMNTRISNTSKNPFEQHKQSSSSYKSFRFLLLALCAIALHFPHVFPQHVGTAAKTQRSATRIKIKRQVFFSLCLCLSASLFLCSLSLCLSRTTN